MHPMDDQLVGYLLNALDEDARRQVETYLHASPDARRKLESLRTALSPLESDRAHPAPPAGLAERTVAPRPPGRPGGAHRRAGGGCPAPAAAGRAARLRRGRLFPLALAALGPVGRLPRRFGLPQPGLGLARQELAPRAADRLQGWPPPLL